MHRLDADTIAVTHCNAGHLCATRTVQGSAYRTTTGVVSLDAMQPSPDSPTEQQDQPQETRYFIGMQGGLRISTCIGPARWKGPAMPVPLSAFGHGAATVSEVLAAESPTLYPVSEAVWQEWTADYPEDDAAHAVAQVWCDAQPADRAAVRDEPVGWEKLAAALDHLVAERDAAEERSRARAQGPQ